MNDPLPPGKHQKHGAAGPDSIEREELRRGLQAGVLAGVLLLVLGGTVAGIGWMTLPLAGTVAGSGLLAIALWGISRRVVMSRHRLLLWRLALLMLCGLQLVAWGIFTLEAVGQGAALQLAVGLGGLAVALFPAAFWLPGYLALLGGVAVIGPLTQPAMAGFWVYTAVLVAAVLGLLAAATRWRARKVRRAETALREQCRSLQANLADAEARAAKADELRHRCEKELANVRQLAEAAGRAKTEFLATISHEIRTPLNGILPILDLLQGTDLEEEQRRYVRTALSSSRHLLRIINDILDYARAESGKLQLESIELDLRDLTQGVLDLMAGSAERKGLKLTLDVDEAVPGRVRGDPIRLRQIVANLVSNAIKFTERGEVTVAIELQRAARREVELRFSVTDTGIGLSRKAAGRLFESFTQADASTTRKHGGTGLGLAICRRLVELMGGTIGVRSRAGVGSTFWFVLPMRRSFHDVPNARKTLEGVRLLTLIPDAKVADGVARELKAWAVKYEQVQPAELMGRLLDAARLGRTWAFEGLLIDSWGSEQQLVPLLRKIREEPLLQGLKVIVATHSESTGRRLQREFAVHVLDGGLQRSSLQRLLNRLFDVDPGASYQGESEDLVGFRDLNMEQELTLEDEQATAPAPAPAGTMEDGALRALLVEDNPVNSGVVRRVLERLGVACEVVENGQLALQRLRAAAFDLVLMDCQMPVMDGYQATRAWREHEARTGGHLPIIAMTANAMQGDREKCLAAGMDDYLAKPVSMQELSAALARWRSDGSGGREPTRQPPQAASSPAERRVLDRDVLGELREVMEDGFGDLVNTYLETSPALMDELRRANKAGDLEAMVIPAHSLKSSSANMGAMQLSALAREVEMAAREGRKEDALAASERMPALHEASCKALRAELETG